MTPEDFQPTLKRLNEQARKSVQGDSFNERQLDTAFNAVNLEELDHVIENTTNRIVQDYALVKKSFFYTIKGMRYASK